MAYVLEDGSEFDRLEVQSTLSQYDYVIELLGFKPRERGTILDAGSGSGVVSRYLARRFPASAVTGFDISESRIAAARKAANEIPRLSFRVENIVNMSVPDHTFDDAISRYVFQHLSEDDQAAACSELFRVLSPGGSVCIIDADGMMENLHPADSTLTAGIQRVLESRLVDTRVGRKLPSLMRAAGFVDIDWHVIPMVFKQDELAAEIAQYEERFTQAAPSLAKIFASEAAARDFRAQFLACLRAPAAVLYYTKFVVTARKPLPSLPTP